MNAGNAADSADPDKDTVANLMEYAFGMNPMLADAGQLPMWEVTDSGLRLQFNRPASVSGVSYAAESSQTMAPESWVSIANSAADPGFDFFAPMNSSTQFLRLRVSVP